MLPVFLHIWKQLNFCFPLFRKMHVGNLVYFLHVIRTHTHTEACMRVHSSLARCCPVVLPNPKPSLTWIWTWAMGRSKSALVAHSKVHLCPGAQQRSWPETAIDTGAQTWPSRHSPPSRDMGLLAVALPMLPASTGYFPEDRKEWELPFPPPPPPPLEACGLSSSHWG